MRKHYLPVLFCLLFKISTLAGQDSASPDRMSMDRFMQEAAENLQVRLFYDSAHFTDSMIFEVVGSDFEPEFIALLKARGLSVIKYHPTQWIVAPSADVNTSLATWQTRERLMELQEEAERSMATTLLIIGSPDSVDAQVVGLSGTVTDETSGEPVIGATVSLVGGGVGTVTDESGGFVLDVPLGEGQLKVRSIGYANWAEQYIAYSSGWVQVILSEGSIELQEVIVSETAPDNNVRNNVAGVERLEMKEIRKLPALFGETDVLKSLLSLPGVSTSGEGVGGINVRGGNVDHNLILSDDIIYFNPSHALGFFSLFHPDLVDEVRLYKGGIPARYGGRLASVLAMETRSGNSDLWRLRGGLGVVTSKLAAEGPLGDNTTFIAGGRVAYPNFVLKQVKVPDVKNSRASFYDIQTKVDHRLTDRSSIGVQGYYGFDNFQFATEAKFEYQSTAVSIYYKHLLGDNTNMNARVTYGRYDSDLFDIQSEDPLVFITDISYLKGNIDFVSQLGNGSQLVYGAEGIRYSINPGELEATTSDSEFTPESSQLEQGIELAAFIDLLWPLSSRLEVSAGLRTSGLLVTGPRSIYSYDGNTYLPEKITGEIQYSNGEIIDFYSGLEPRLGLKYNTGATSSIKLGYNRTYQYLSLISNTVAATPVDFWKLTDSYMEAQSAHSFSLGFYKNFKQNEWETFVEGYYKILENVPEYRDFPDLVVNDHLEQELLPAEGQNYGVEASVKKNFGRVTGRLSYTWARALRKVASDIPQLEINSGDWYPSNFDKPHSIDFIFNYNFSQRFSFNLFFTYSTGRPISVPVGSYKDWNILNIPLYSERNAYRIPDYHRMDIAFTLFPGYRKDRRWRSSWTLSLFNVYSRRNAYSVFFEQASFQLPAANRLAVLGSVFPSLTYNFEF